MQKIGVDIKNGNFTIYPSGEILSFIEGFINKSYYRQIGQSKQLKVVISNEDKEYTINCIIGNVTYESLVTTLIENTSAKVNLVLEKRNNGIRDYYLVTNNI